MELGAVREAYGRLAGTYVASFGDTTLEHADDRALVRRNLSGLAGRVLDLGCGPGHWTAWLDALGADVAGVDAVPEFVEHARSRYPHVSFAQDDLTSLDLEAGSVAGILSWYSTIHLRPTELPGVLAGFHRALSPSGVLVLGFFDSADHVAAFDHAVVTAYRWPVDVMASRLSAAGFVEVERLQRQVPERPDRRYAALAVHAGAGWSP